MNKIKGIQKYISIYNYNDCTDTMLTLKNQTFVFVESVFTRSIQDTFKCWQISFFRVCPLSTAVQIRSCFNSENSCRRQCVNWQFYTYLFLPVPALYLFPNAKDSLFNPWCLNIMRCNEPYILHVLAVQLHTLMHTYKQFNIFLGDGRKPTTLEKTRRESRQTTFAYTVTWGGRCEGARL